jgi:transposase
MQSLNQSAIKHKLGLLNLAAELGNVSRACKVMGLSRDTFYRYQAAVQEGGVEALIEQTRRKPNPKNRVDESTEAAVCKLAIDQPAFGQVRASNELRKAGLFVSPSGVRSIWQRHGLACFKQRLAALEKSVAHSGAVLTEAQVAPPWRRSARTTWRTVRSKRPIQAIWDRRTPSTWAPSRAWAASINRAS